MTSFIRQDGKLINMNAHKPAAPTYDYEFVFDSLEVANMFHEAVKIFRSCVATGGTSYTCACKLSDLVDRMHGNISSPRRAGHLTFNDHALRVMVSHMFEYAHGIRSTPHPDLKEFAKPEGGRISRKCDGIMTTADHESILDLFARALVSFRAKKNPSECAASLEKIFSEMCDHADHYQNIGEEAEYDYALANTVNRMAKYFRRGGFMPDDLRILMERPHD